MHDDYVIFFLQFWIFIFGVPASVFFSAILSLSNNKIWRSVWGSIVSYCVSSRSDQCCSSSSLSEWTLQVHISLCTTSVALGGCFSVSILLINATSGKPSEEIRANILHAYFIVGLIGEVFSLLGLVSSASYSFTHSNNCWFYCSLLYSVLVQL